MSCSESEERSPCSSDRDQVRNSAYLELRGLGNVSKLFKAPLTSRAYTIKTVSEQKNRVHLLKWAWNAASRSKCSILCSASTSFCTHRTRSCCSIDLYLFSSTFPLRMNYRAQVCSSPRSTASHLSSNKSFKDQYSSPIRSQHASQRYLSGHTPIQ